MSGTSRAAARGFGIVGDVNYTVRSARQRLPGGVRRHDARRPLRQQATLQSARGAWQQAQTPANVLRYALVLGTPGHDDSNPLEASRLLGGLLAAPEGLSTDELRLATAFQREFTARVQQYADLARTRIDADAHMRATETEAQARINAMSADLARLRRERDIIQQKLDAIADIEKSLMERDDALAGILAQRGDGSARRRHDVAADHLRP